MYSVATKTFIEARRVVFSLQATVDPGIYDIQFGENKAAFIDCADQLTFSLDWAFRNAGRGDCRGGFGV